MRKYYIHIAIVILSVFIAGISVYKRNAQFNYWLKHKNVFFTHNYSSVTTLDAYYWLRQARFFNEGRYDGKHRYFLNTYPNTKGSVLKEPPFISYVLAKFYKFFSSDGYNHLYVGSIKLINLLASLFIIPLILIFYKLGFPSAGVLGGLIGSFSWAYYPRSCTGRIDTDSLLLFFPFLAILITMFIPNFKSRYIKIILAFLTGIVLNLYAKWHGAALSYNFIFTWLFLIFLFFHKEDKKNMVLMFFTLIIGSNPINFLHGLGSVFSLLGSSYFAGILHAKASLQLPNIINTITETQKKSAREVINMVYAMQPLFWLGIIGFVAMFVKHWRKVFLFLPLFGLGMMSFWGSNRFALFLAPFIGVGIGYIFELIIFYLLNIYKKNRSENHKLISNGVGIVIVLVIFFAFKNKTAYSMIPPPSIKVATINSFINLKKILPKHAAVFTWWDYGYCLQEIPEFATYHDGGHHGGIATYLVGKGFTLNNQEKLYNMLSFWEHFKNEGMRKVLKKSFTGFEFLSKILDYDKGSIKYPTYILYTGDMIGKYGAISYFGNWDFNRNKSFPDGYSYLRCSSIKNNVLYCSNLDINLTKGEINFKNRNGKALLKKTVFANNGYVVREINYPDNKNGIFLQLLMKKNKIFNIMLLNNRLFSSNFNQQFLLGNIDKKLYKEVYNNFPVARAFKVLPRKN